MTSALTAASIGFGPVTWITLVVATAAVVALVRTSRSSLSVAEQRFRRVFEDAPTAMALADLDMTILDANAAFGALLGRPVEELVGHNIAAHSEPGDMLVQRRLHEELLAGETSHYTM